MKEIIFRGKRKDNNEWVQGYYFKRVRNYAGLKTIEHCYIQYETWDEGLITYEVHPETVSQFTGLTDRFGKMIFEGHIVNIITDINGYKSTYSSTVQEVKYIADNGVAVFYPFNNSDMVEVEVIGNIYDDKELLDGKDKG